MLKLHIVVKLAKNQILGVSIVALVIFISAALLFVNKNKVGFPLFQGSDKNSQSKEATGETSQELPDGQAVDGGNLVENLPQGVSAKNLKPPVGKTGSGTFIAVSDDKNFSLIIETKLGDLATGKNYTAWLLKNNNLSNPIKLGKLEKTQGVYSLTFSSVDDYSSYKYIVVTEEASDDNTPETKILESQL